ncbi:MAG: CHAD domain-containing protein [Magnetovibrionaceae bacterium]
MANKSSAVETELKFLIAEKDLARVRRPSWLSGLQDGRAKTRSLDSTYFDTPDMALRQASSALRLRLDGSNFLQCLKARMNNGASGGFARHEWEMAVPSAALDLEALAAAGAAEALGSIEGSELKPVFRSVFKRVSRRYIPKVGSAISFDLDEGEVISGRKKAPIRELELELEEGDPAELFRFARALLEKLDLRLSTVNKADRGYRLFSGAGPDWSKAPAVAMDADINAEDALSAMVMGCIQHLRENEECAFHRSHIEGVHQMRVAARRLRSVLNAYKKVLPPEDYERLNGGFKGLINAMGPARDWDVFLDETILPLKAARPGDQTIDRLAQLAEREQRRGYDAVRRALSNKAYTDLILETSAWALGREWRNNLEADQAIRLGGPARAFASELIEKRHKRLLKDGKHFKSMTAEERHALRIDVKKVRYAAELFAPLFSAKKTANYFRHLKALQDGLGILNDVAVAEGLMATLSSRARGDDVKPVHLAAGKVIGWQTQVAAEKNKDLAEIWVTFKKTRAFWRA